MVVPTRHPPRPTGSPSPNHRGNIMNERQSLAAPSQPLRDAPAEPRTVYRHDGIGAKRPDHPYRLAHPAEYHWSARQHFGDPHYRQIIERNQAFEPLVLHPLTADAGDPKIFADALPQRRYQRTTKGVARRFSSNKEDEGRFGCGHNRPTPTTNSPVRSAVRMTSSRSSTIVASASMAIPLNPVSAASVTVRKPIVGRS